jgi:hypothetical protein
MNGDGDTPQKSDKQPDDQRTAKTDAPTADVPADLPPSEAGEWQYNPEQPVADSSAPLPSNDTFTPASSFTPGPQEVTWTASEFIAQDKGFGWFVGLVVAAVGVTAIAWFVTKDYISVVVIIAVAIVLGVLANRKPRVLEYAVDRDGLEIAGKFFPYVEFRSFSVVQEGAFSSIMLVPLKRFAPPISIYYPPDDEDKIVNVIATHLPMEEHHHDMIDRFAKRIRF